MPYTEKQNRYFHAIENGWKPDDPKLNGKLSAGKAKSLLDEANVQGQKKALQSMK